MSADRSQWTRFLSHNLKLACAECCVQRAEITYTLRSVVDHRCPRDLLLSKDEATGKWRPVARRPALRNPNRYEVCHFFAEGSGCARHKSQCTFARSDEEAAVWNFEKRQGLDRAALVGLIDQTDAGSVRQSPARPGGRRIESFTDLSATLELRAACSSCSVQEKEVTYAFRPLRHRCGRDLLLARVAPNPWRPVSPRPAFNRPGQRGRYQVCFYFTEGSGCRRHGERCSFARSHEEAAVWNFEKDNGVDRDALVGLAVESEVDAARPQRTGTAEDAFKEFLGEFLELCKDCFHGAPQRVAAKGRDGACSADAAHAWNPLLVHHRSDGRGKDVYSRVRPLPPRCRFEYCSYVRLGRPCWHGYARCPSAQSEVEP